MGEILAILAGILKFWDEVVFFIKLLQKTPVEKVKDVIAEVNAAFDKADKTNETSDIEDIFNRS